MFTHPSEQQSLKDANLARTHPEAYKTKAEADGKANPVGYFIDFLKRLFAKKAK